MREINLTKKPPEQRSNDHFFGNLNFFTIKILTNLRRENNYSTYQEMFKIHFMELGIGIASHACGDISLKTPFFLN
ncbi:hypothetical protein AC477_01910 [miscellaneous Crenarchaeota group-1 archaeon SG8-32-1]|uniref:Uncharacterized protein n=1 Tax=miscellaneous Crenarchaeota group-1 archaeon SG8-32-1 TaxID=1685124 RepID=A0A0M0BXR5_9ARCH|nr:MAG: hypothetical protein AC477_01910 [miscellaneous Crenarchaeota group-1 archaeon SG8-32-1]